MTLFHSNIQTNTQRNVRFMDTDEVLDIPTVNDLTQEEKDAIWFTDEEYTAIHQKIFKLARKMEKGRGVHYCTRGLEKMVGQRMEEAAKTRAIAYEAVLMAQHEQRMMNVRDEEALAQDYAVISHYCQCRAMAAAVEDAEIIKKYFLPKSSATVDRQETTTMTTVPKKAHSDASLQSTSYQLASPHNQPHRRPSMNPSRGRDALTARCA